MFKERLQILINSDQRRRLDAEAKRRRTSVASVIREAIDERLVGAAPGDRLRAVAEIRAMTGSVHLPPEALNRIVAEERERNILGSEAPIPSPEPATRRRRSLSAVSDADWKDPSVIVPRRRRDRPVQ